MPNSNDFPIVNIENVDISPNPAALTDKLDLEVDFTLNKNIENAYWEIKYLVDSVEKRHIIILGKTPVKTFKAGKSHFQFSVPEIDVSNITPSRLTNCGLLISTLKVKEKEIMDLKMVIQVSEHKDGLQRKIFNPLE